MQNSCRKNSEETCTFWKKKKKKDVCNSHLFHSTVYNAGHEVINSQKPEQKKIGVLIFSSFLLGAESDIGIWKQKWNFTKKVQLQFFFLTRFYVCVFAIFMGRRLLTRHFPFTVFVGSITISLFLSARRKPNRFDLIRSYSVRYIFWSGENRIDLIRFYILLDLSRNAN